MGRSLILASASPRRRELLGQAGVEFRVLVSNVPEDPRPGEDPAGFVRRVAGEKAAAVARDNPGAWVLGADTAVVVGGRILGKPSDAADASRMLRLLSGRTHHVLTGVVLIGETGGEAAALVADSAVDFRELSDREIESYVATGEPLDKAGAYAIQGGAGAFVRALRGSYTNVVGLPVEEVTAMLRGHGLLGGPEPAESGAGGVRR